MATWACSFPHACMDARFPVRSRLDSQARWASTMMPIPPLETTGGILLRAVPTFAPGQGFDRRLTMIQESLGPRMKLRITRLLQRTCLGLLMGLTSVALHFRTIFRIRWSGEGDGKRNLFAAKNRSQHRLDVLCGGCRQSDWRYCTVRPVRHEAGSVQNAPRGWSLNDCASGFVDVT
jgi:hypothetical protein